MSSRQCANLQDKGDHIAFINSIRLSWPRFSLPDNFENKVRSARPEDHKEEGYVVSGAVMAFTANVSGQAKHDILNATLFTQLACDKNFDSGDESIHWYRYYNQILGHLGFGIQNFSFNEYHSSGSGLRMHEAVLEIIAAIATGGELAVITATLDALRQLSDSDEKITLFDSHCKKSRGGRFQVCACDQAENGDVTLKVGAFYYTSNEDGTNILFFSWNSSTCDFYRGVQRFVLNSEIYGRVRHDVAHKLAINAVRLVDTIDI